MRWLSLGVLAAVAAAGWAQAGWEAVQAPQSADLTQILSQLSARELGPTTMGGRVSDIAVYEKEPRIFYSATASGGLWKTTNSGLTMTPVFYKEAVVALGAVAVDPNNPDHVWVGTGEQNSRNSTSFGGGVFKSTDGGQTWENVGLEKTMHISQIIIDPRNANTVYVGALGQLWGFNQERGVYKTTDGGKTWTQVLKVDEKTGCVDLVMHPTKPDVLLAAMYQRERKAYMFASGGPGSALFKTTDGGKSWRKITRGIPTTDLGRIGLDVMQNKPNIWMASIEAAGDDTRGVFRSFDEGDSWERVNPINPRPFYFSIPRQDPQDEDRMYLAATNFHFSTDGGKTFRNMNMNIHVDYHALWINPKDNKHIIAGNDGGLAITRDQGETWEHINQQSLAQFYAVGVDMRKPYWVYGGLQDNGTWGGPTQTMFGGVKYTDWIMVSGGDGFHAQVDPTDWRIVYTESQGGAIQRTNIKTGERQFIRPRAPQGERYRFNWSTPFVISPHNPHTLYLGGNRLFKTVDQGSNWKAISPDLTTNDSSKIGGSYGVSPENTGAEVHCTIITISESPMEEGLIYVGTDDGLVQLTRDGGQTWTNLTANIPGLPANTWCSRVTASSHEVGTVYATFDGHRNNDYKPYVYASNDYGQNWVRIDRGLTEGNSCYVIKEGLRNPELLILGTEMGMYVSLDKGASWTKYMSGFFGTIRVDDAVIHPRELDLVVGTHGRGIWIVPFSAMEQLTKENREKDVFLCQPQTTYLMGFQSSSWYDGNRNFVSPNTQPNARIDYWLKDGVEGNVRLRIESPSGENMTTLNGTGNAGLNTVEVSGGRLRRLSAGDYSVVLQVGDNEYRTTLHIEDLGQAEPTIR